MGAAEPAREATHGARDLFEVCVVEGGEWELLELSLADLRARFFVAAQKRPLDVVSEGIADAIELAAKRVDERVAAVAKRSAKVLTKRGETSARLGEPERLRSALAEESSLKGATQVRELAPDSRHLEKPVRLRTPVEKRSQTWHGALVALGRCARE